MSKDVCTFLLLITIGFGLSGCGGANGKSGANQANGQGGTTGQSPAGSNSPANKLTPTNNPPPLTVSPTPASRSSTVTSRKMPSSQIGSGGNDFFLFTQARAAIDAEPELKRLNITLDVKEGVATMTGTVATAKQKARAEQVVRDVGGVKSVNNELRVLR